MVEHRLESITSIHLYFKSLYMDYKEFLFRKKKTFWIVLARNSTLKKLRSWHKVLSLYGK